MVISRDYLDIEKLAEMRLRTISTVIMYDYITYYIRMYWKFNNHTHNDKKLHWSMYIKMHIHMLFMKKNKTIEKQLTSIHYTYTIHISCHVLHIQNDATT